MLLSHHGTRNGNIFASFQTLVSVHKSQGETPFQSYRILASPSTCAPFLLP